MQTLVALPLLLLLNPSLPRLAYSQGHPSAEWVAFSSFTYIGEDDGIQSQRVGEKHFLNPILPGMYPDPSIIRVASEYYLVNSTFNWYPGLPIFKSEDLIHWRQIGHVLDRPDQLQLAALNVSRGLFAPTIRYHNGLFYVINTNVGGIGNFYVTAHNPAGPWSSPILLPQVKGIDPSFFFDDDGSANIVYCGDPPEGKELYPGHRAIWMLPFDPLTGKVSGAGKVLINGGTDLATKPYYVEGPHLFKRNGFYYLIAAQGGTNEFHSEVVFRSTSIDGPYTSYPGNPILTQRTLDPSRPNPIANTGHADFVQISDGSWWAVFLGTRPYKSNLFNTGRETFLLPVVWKNDWPTILPSGEPVPRSLPAPNLPDHPTDDSMPSGSFTWTDNFRKPQLNFAWNMLRTPKERWWRIEPRAGQLLLSPRVDDLGTPGNPSFLARRQQHASFTASLTVHPLLHVDHRIDAGLAVFQGTTSYYYLAVSTRPVGPPLVLLEEADTATNSGRAVRIAAIELPRNVGPVDLKVINKGADISFLYRIGKSNWMPVRMHADATVLSTKSGGGFVGTYIGPFARLSPARPETPSAL